MNKDFIPKIAPLNKLVLVSSIVGLLLLVRCVSNNQLEIGSGKDVIVTLEVIDKTDIEKIAFQTRWNKTIVTHQDLENYRFIRFGMDLSSAEGTCAIHVYTSNDTLNTALYVENGYRPKLKCTSKRIELESHSGY